MDKQFYYQTKKDTIQDVMRFAAIAVDSDLQPADILRMLDKYLMSSLDSIDNILNELQNGEPKPF